MSRPPISLGTFEIFEPIGRGGMGEVWRGRHVADDVPVAVKIMNQVAMRQPDYQAAFRNEVRAVAGLDHPGIIILLDHGVVSERAEHESVGMLVQGSPYIVMEYASRGSLYDIMAELTWSDTRHILITMLDALGHAHARAVIHRDLKPENILIGCGEVGDSEGGVLQGPSGIKLTDFGLAHASDRFERTGSVESGWGTPHYMAPEQFRGLWRDYGSWTDLYGLGCMAYELVTGKAPFSGRTVVEMGNAHITERPAPLKPRFAVPQGFDAWVSRLMEKEPRHRFELAADAAWALSQLGEPSVQTSTGTLHGLPGADALRAVSAPTGEKSTRILSHLAQEWADTRPVTFKLPGWSASAEEEPWVEVDPDDMWCQIPPLADCWRLHEASRPSLRLLGAGQGLFGLRAIPMVDRDTERDLVWAKLGEVRAAHSARVVLLRGEAGTGKSRLAQWMCQRANELGAASVMKAVHGPVIGAGDGLNPMLAREFRCVKLTRAESSSRIEEVLRRQGVSDEYEWAALTELIAADLATGKYGEAEPESEGDKPTILLSSVRQRHALTYRVVHRMAMKRPVILWLDDVQWGGDALGFVNYILEAQSTRPAAVLVVMTVRDETLGKRPIERSLVAEILESARATECRIGPLEGQDSLMLVQELLGLDEELARYVDTRTGGIPLFAVQLVGDWVAQGKLRVGKKGFEIAPGERVDIPDDIRQIWDDRLAHLPSLATPAARLALEAAAALGQEIDEAEWREVCVLLNVSSETLVESLVAAGLARSTEGSWSFAHGMLRESLERSAREKSRWPALNSACAQMLTRLYRLDALGLNERLGLHLIEAGQVRDALEPLLVAAAEHTLRSDFARAHSLLDRRKALVESTRLLESDPALGRGWVQRAAILEQQGRYAEALTFARRAGQGALEHRWDGVLPQALLQKGLAETQLGQLGQAETYLQRAGVVFEATQNHAGVAQALLGRGRIEELRGDFEQAEELIDEAKGLFGLVGDQVGVARCLNALGDCARQRGDLELAETKSRQAMELSEKIGNRIGVADCLNDLAELSRLQGNLELARQRSLKALKLYESLDSEQSMFVGLNLGLVYLLQQNYVAAQAVFWVLERHSRSGNQSSLLAHALVGLLAGWAKQSDWESWDRGLEEVEEILRLTGISSPYIATTLDVAAEAAESVGDVERAKRARFLRSQKDR